MEVIFDDIEDDAMVGPILEADEEQLIMHEEDEHGSEVCYYLPLPECHV